MRNRHRGVHFDNRVGDFLSSLNDAGSVDDAWIATVALMRNFGASHICILADFQETDPILQSTSPSWIRDLYLSEVYPDHCLDLKQCLENKMPYFHGIEFEGCNQSLSAPRRRYLKEMSTLGIRSGTSIPIDIPSSKNRGVFDYRTNLGADEHIELMRERGATIHLAGLLAFEKIRSLMDAEEARDICLTPRERECLLWLARGLRNDGIAHRMGLRPVTVEFHLANARRKLGARTREQALAIAVHKGLVEP